MSIEEKNIVLHVGLPKTGTSFLQLEVFPNIRNTYHSGNGDYLNVHKTPLNFLMSLNVEKNILKKDKEKKAIIDFISKKDKQNFLYSSEGLVGIAQSNYSTNKLNTSFLKELFPQAKILFVFRRQDNWLASIYNQYIIKEKRNIKINVYLGIKGNNFVKNKFLQPDKFNWLSLYNNYIEAFGKENVLALPYEMMKQDITGFLDLFYEFSKLDPFYPQKTEYKNKKTEDYAWNDNFLLKSYLNLTYHLPVGKFRNIIEKNDKGFKIFLKLFDSRVDLSNEKLTKEQKKIILNYHQKSNKKLSKLIGINLGQYGYY